MSENLTPGQHARLDLVAMNKDKRTTATKGARSRKGHSVGEMKPMATERIYNVNQRNNNPSENELSDREKEVETPRMQLISPPPEEMLRRLHDHQVCGIDVKCLCRGC